MPNKMSVAFATQNKPPFDELRTERSHEATKPRRVLRPFANTWLVLVLTVAWTGCASTGPKREGIFEPRPAGQETQSPEGVEGASGTESESASGEVAGDAQERPDPEVLLRRTLERSVAQETYTVEFRRRERQKTLFGSEMGDPEHMHAKYRAEPLSIRMDFEPPSTFVTVVYVAGRNDNKIRCKWRKGFLGGEPPVNDYDPDFAVKFGFSRSPMTDFGVAKLMRKILDTYERTTAEGHPPQVSYGGVRQVEGTGTEAHHIELLYDPATGLERTKVELLVDLETELPAACYLWLPNGKLDAKYLYSDFDLTPTLSESDFEIE